MKRIRTMRDELKIMAEQEATKLYRLARRAQKHECNQTTINQIRDEATWLNTTATAYPDRLIHFDFEYRFKYAFR